MTHTLIGYARCSTDKQDLAAQRAALEALGVAADRVYVDHGLSGKTRARPGLDQALAAVRAGMSLREAVHGLEQFRAWFDQWGLWVILIKGLTPIPYKLVTIASGLAAFSFPVFIAASVATRGGRFFLEAWILKRWGPAMLAQVEKRLALWTGAGLVALIALIVVLKVL